MAKKKTTFKYQLWKDYWSVVVRDKMIGEVTHAQNDFWSCASGSGSHPTVVHANHSDRTAAADCVYDRWVATQSGVWTLVDNHCQHVPEDSTKGGNVCLNCGGAIEAGASPVVTPEPCERFDGCKAGECPCEESWMVRLARTEMLQTKKLHEQHGELG